MPSRGLRRRVLTLALAAVGSVLPLAVDTPTASAADVTNVGTTVVSGFHHSCVLKSDNTVACWGRNQSFQVGVNPGNHPFDAVTDPNGPFQSVPATVPALTNVASVSAGDEHSCALKTDGTVWCWGSNQHGQLGQPLTGGGAIFPDTPNAMQVPGITTAVGVTTGSFHSCAVLKDGTVQCWGQQSVNQVGTTVATIIDPDGAGPADARPVVSTPTTIAGLANVLAIDAGAYFTCALIADGTVRCWGSNISGALGTDTALGASTGVPQTVAGLDRINGITAGFAHACARKTSGAVLCWGANDKGQLGDGGDGPTSQPQPVVGLTSGVTSLVAGYYHNCAVRQDGTAACWGENTHGQLGNNSTTSSNVPVTVTGLTNASAIAPGFAHTCAVRLDQKVACWGGNQYGTVADDASPVDSLVPKIVAGLVAINTAPAVTPPGGGSAPTPAPVVTDQPYRSLVQPERVLDTRDAATVDGLMRNVGLVGPGVVEVPVAGRGSTPSGAASVFVNVTVVDPRGQGYVTVYPCGQVMPSSSNVNFVAGQNVANAAVSRVGDGGKVCLYASVATHLVMDVAGYFPDSTSFSPLVKPVRLLDTRVGGSTDDHADQGVGRQSGGSVYALQVSGRSPLPGGVASVALNVTVDNAADAGYLTVYPCDQGMPNASVVNYQAGQTIAGLVVAKASAAGTVCIFTSAAADLIADASGYFATAVSYTPLANPVRFMETRAGAPDTPDHVAHGEGPRAGGSTYKLTVGGRNGISATAGAVLLSIAVPSPQQDGFVTVYPCGTSRPESSNLNYQAGKTIANTVAAGIGSARQVCIYVYGTTDVIVDVAGTLA